MVKAILQTQWSGQRHRMPGTAAAKAELHLSESQLQTYRNEVREELNRGMAQSLISVEYCEPHLIWSMDIFEKWHHGIKFHVLQVIDLGSRIKLEPLIKECAFTGDEIAEHINMLMHFHGAPLFLKRDNGTNLNSGSILEILNLFGAIPVNSPPYCPQYNGVMERSQGEIKRYLNVLCKDKTKDFDLFSACVHMAIMRANGRKRKAKLHTTVYVIDCQVIKLRKVSPCFFEQLNSIVIAYDTSVRCILESSSRYPNIRTIAPPNNLVLRVPCRPPIIPVCGRTHHTV